jgi:Family of unknown function (DUF6159)
MGRFGRSWELAKSSWSVLQADLELLWLPIMSFFATVATAALFFVPIWTMSQTDSVNGSELSVGPIGWVLIALSYVALAYVTIFFNTALIHAADERMRGGDPTVKSALRGATKRAGSILPWAIVSATVSVILRAIQERAGILGRIVAGVAGIAWTLVTFLVLPILVIEGIGVRDAIKRSSEMFKRTWGEQVIANAGISLVSLVAIIAGLPVLFLAATGITALVILGVGIFVAWIAVVVAVTSALSVVYQTALYHYAANGMPPAAFANVNLRGAFAAKRR